MSDDAPRVFKRTVVTPTVSPATTVTGPDSFGAPAVVGTSKLYARQDHDHGLPANPAPSPATTVTGPDTFGAPAVVGTSKLYARQDHDHGLPAASGGGPTIVRTTTDQVFTSASYANTGLRFLMTANRRYNVKMYLNISDQVGLTTANFEIKALSFGSLIFLGAYVAGTPASDFFFTGAAVQAATDIFTGTQFAYANSAYWMLEFFANVEAGGTGEYFELDIKSDGTHNVTLRFDSWLEYTDST